MTTTTGLLGNVESHLRRTGWIQQPPGPLGSLWVHARDENAIIAVPSDLDRSRRDYEGVVDRLATFEHRSRDEVREAIERQLMDVARLRASNDILISGSIPLTAGAQLVNSAAKMLRASANSARSPRAHFAGSYSKLADDVAKRARMGHTQEGSYIVPVFMPLSEAPKPSVNEPTLIGAEIESVAWEPEERRVMRTFAETLTTIERQIIRPARPPQRSELAALVSVGISREFVSAVHDIVSDSAVVSFGASFSWAPGLRPPPSASHDIDIPAEAGELLGHTASLLATTRVDTMETVSGPIVEVRHIPEDPSGSISVQTVRNGRPAEVRITLSANQLDDALEWMRSGRTVITEGKIVRTPGHPLRIERPESLQPLDQRMLPQD